MASEESIVRFSAEEIAGMLRRGEDRTNWAKVLAKSDAQIAADIASDPQCADLDDAWRATATRLVSSPTVSRAERVSVDLDGDVVAYFRAEPGRWQDKINAVLRSFVALNARTND